MRKLVSDTGLYNVAESIDRLINVDIGARGTAQVLFDAARDLLGGKPMTLAAVELKGASGHRHGRLSGGRHEDGHGQLRIFRGGAGSSEGVPVG